MRGCWASGEEEALRSALVQKKVMCCRKSNRNSETQNSRVFADVSKTVTDWKTFYEQSDTANYKNSVNGEAQLNVFIVIPSTDTYLLQTQCSIQGGKLQLMQAPLEWTTKREIKRINNRLSSRRDSSSQASETRGVFSYTTTYMSALVRVL